MHFSVLVFHNGDIDSVLKKYYYDADSDDGADITFNDSYTAKQAENLFKKHKNSNEEDKDKYSDVDDFMECYHGCVKKDGAYGHYSNTDGMYDWYEVGGRWSNLLPDFSDEEEIAKLVKKALNLKTKKVKEKFRDNMGDYISISQMPVLEAAVALEIGAANSMLVNEKVTPEMIMDWWINQYNKQNTDEKYTRENIFDDITEYLIFGETGEVKQGITVEEFIEAYNHYAELNKNGNEFYLTMVDMHT